MPRTGMVHLNSDFCEAVDSEEGTPRQSGHSSRGYCTKRVFESLSL